MPVPTTAPSDPDVEPPSSPLSSQTARLLAVVAGLIAVIAAVLVPLLPVSQTSASVSWPQGQDVNADDPSVVAPLIAQTAQSVDLVIPCAALATLPAEGATVLSTMPAKAKGASQRTLAVTANRTSVTVSMRANVAASASRADIDAGRCGELHVFSSASATGAQFTGLGPASDLDPSTRPQIDGFFTSLSTPQVTAMADAGMHARIDVDNRYESSPSILKVVVMVITVLAALLALFALWCLDRSNGYTGRLLARSKTLLAHIRPRLSDAVVTVVLVVWTFLGAAAPDDGYILTMGRAADASGYLSNYYRFYGIAEAPFDWYYSFLSLWSQVSTTIVWMHLPILVAGLASWFVLSRIVLPHLLSGSGAAGLIGRFGSRAWAVATAAAVFLAFWLPFCSGLRTEGIIVLGSLLTWWATESAITRRRLLPAALAATLAAGMLALAPQGVIGVAILLVAARPLLHVLLDRRREAGLLALLAPMIAAGTVVSVIVFRDQTLMTVLEAMKTRYQTGPIIPWHQEFLRYFFLTVTTPDGALARRIPVLLLFVAAIVTAAVLLRRRSIAGVASSQTWRLIGAFGVTLLLFFLSPVKWTIHFGVFAGFGAALAAVACLAIAQAGARSSRNLSLLSVGLLFALAAAAAGKNAWPYAYRFGITWFDMAPALKGIQISSILLALAVVAVAVALWQHLRNDYVANKGLAHHDAGQPDSAGDRRRLMFAHTPLVLIAGLMVVATFTVFGKAVVTRSPAMTVFSNNVASLGGGTCGMADQVLAEPDPNKGMLVPAKNATPTAALTGDAVGFSPEGIPADLTPTPSSARAGQMHVGGSVSKPFSIIGGLGAGTTGGTGPRTVNGSTHALPFGLDPATTPVLGSYGFPANAYLTTGWYTLPARDASPIIAFSTAGAVSTIDRDGHWRFGQKLVAQFGKPGPDGEFVQVGGDVVPIDAGPITPNLPWRNLRVPMTSVPAAATVLRLNLADTNLGPAQFIAITPPRAPELRTLQEMVGSTDPTLVDFMAAAQFPCQNPMTFPHGVTQVPRWRILPDFVTANSQSRTWMAADGGGPLSIVESTTSQVTVPTYLRDDWHEDWGSVERLTPLSPDAATARVDTEPVTQWGWHRTGSIRLEPNND
ncbi:arabinosyltransferase domain-containing protein [Gordonia sp. HY002]|uniref:arabinosyltransferase domain-containing protein n=1 Tax=Gordonia zhenghanii TaxID=2911516 RepID=UPI001EF14094|nr:arabinosyltransferase domain-containing protein [Gordonia zhenghanii]MCF8569332.1 arabinosyltransferase domain-containing protein [Gordonia zhenghanii]MCF8604375.1 arabinosyltransferase domain-containing protein [Gordonia zhenghanii]